MTNSMLSSALNHLTALYRRLVNNIAFVPSLIGTSALVLAIVVLYFENRGITPRLEENFGFLLVRGTENARMVLGTIIGSMISLTVFSFSMVMVVLNRSSDALSPRVLPQLVASKTHQVVLGFYMGTIVYSLVLIVNINPDQRIPAFGILLSMIFAIVSLALFIYFIHSISRNIQVDNILEQILRDTTKQMDGLAHADSGTKSGESPVRFDKAIKIKAKRTGYCRVVNLSGLVVFLARKDYALYVPVYQGRFAVLDDTLAFLSGVGVSDDDLDRIARHVYTDDDGDDGYEFHFGLRKISEIAVKALSPGINDPGTALRAIRDLTFLFGRYIDVPKYMEYADKDGEVRAVKKMPELDVLLENHLTPIRQYSGGSTEVLFALVDVFDSLFKMTSLSHRDALHEHFKALRITVQHDVKNEVDRRRMEVRMDEISQREDLGV